MHQFHPVDINEHLTHILLFEIDHIFYLVEVPRHLCKSYAQCSADPIIVQNIGIMEANPVICLYTMFR